jgi:hypothetical protein
MLQVAIYCRWPLTRAPLVICVQLAEAFTPPVVVGGGQV